MCEDFILQVHDIVEFIGPDEPKTQLLMSIIAQCILPKVVSGCEMDVILICTHCKFNILMLLGVLEQKLKLSACNSDRTFLDSILDRFRLFEATSISDCCMILKSLLNFAWLRSGKTGTMMTIIDGIGSLSWENKMSTKSEPKLEDCLEMVKKFVEQNESLAIFGNFPPANNDGYYAKPWMKLVNYRFKLELEGVSVRIQQTFPNSRTFLLHSIR